MDDVVIGIDLGTTNSVVAVADRRRVQVLLGEDGRPLVPSVVSFTPEGPPLVGHAARARRVHDARNTVYSVKRLIGRPFDSPEVERARQRFAFDLVERPGGGVGVRVRDGEVYSLTEISSMVLRELRRIAEGSLGVPVRRAVVTVPANFNELQRSATRAAGRVVGLEIGRILNEPTAAALAYGQERELRRVVVYDLGGGTFDVTVLEMEEDVYEVVATAGDTFLGGDDIDLAVAEEMASVLADRAGRDPRADRQLFERLRAAAEWLKCALSEREQAEARIEQPLGEDSEPFVFELERGRLERLARPFVERSLEVCRQVLEQAGTRRERLDAVVLVGGSTRMPLVRRMVEAFFGRPPETGIDPDLVVAQGAAIHARTLGGFDAFRLPDVLPAPSVEMGLPLEEPAEGRAERRAEEAGESPLAAADTVLVDPGYAQELERLAPGSLRRYTDRGEGLVEVEVELEADPEQGAGRPDGLLSTLPPDGPVPAVLFGVPGATIGGATAAPPATSGHAAPTPDSAHEALPELPDEWLRSEPPSARRPALPPRAVPRPAAAAAPILELRDRPAPLLMDVTPLDLAVETAGGYCQRIIERGTPVPTEQRRMFTTARDGQRIVRVRICQGAGQRFEENQPLGEIELDGLREAPRGAVRIEVTFVLDANGTLDVSARDVDTGRSQSTRVVLLGAESEEELEVMRRRQAELFGEEARRP